MLAIGFIYGAFGGHLCYVVVEKKQRVYKTHIFWLLVAGLLSVTFLVRIAML